MLNELHGYITKVCRDACISAGCSMDVDFQCFVSGNRLIFAMRSPHKKALRRIQYRLEHNLYCNFGIYPYNVEDPKGKITFLCGDIDYNLSFTEWEVFGQWGTLCTGVDPEFNPHFRDVLTLDIGETNRFHEIRAVGFEPRIDHGQLTSNDWQVFSDYYEKAFGERSFMIGETIIVQVKDS